MDSARWRQIEELFHLARERQSGEWSAFLTEACGEDEELKRTVALLLSQDQVSGPLERPPGALIPGQILGHYRVLTKIGAGGMGEVYCAQDEHLQREVALKILPLGFVVDEPSRKRFRREALALSKLNHPNIATIFDFDTQDEISFIAMELIRGTPLNERLRTGPLEEKDALRLAMQLAEGLAAAHAQGVIHRDLKPGNLMITPEGRLKILDFGVAVLTAAEEELESRRTVSETAAVVGTLPYMSPEHLRGQPVDARSDVYGAGAVLYEMITATRPFPEQNAELIGAILHRFPAPPRALQARISPGLQRLVMKALAKDPAQRHQSARELSGALEQLSNRKSSRAPLLAGGLAAVVLLAGVLLVGGLGGVRDRLRAGGTTPAHTSAARRSIAVLGFQNLSGRSDTAWLSTGLSEMFTTEMSAGEQLRTIPGENVARAKLDLRLPEADSLAKDTLARLRNSLGADLVVVGSYVDLGKEAGGKMRVDLRLQDVRDGETITTISVTGTESQLFQLVSDAGAQVRRRLGVGGVLEREATAVRASLPSDPEAARLYAEGLGKLRISDALAARDLLGQAVSREPTNALAHSALSSAWSALGYDQAGIQEARKAYDLSGNLSREDRLTVEGRFREANKEWAQAADVYRSLWAFFPDNIEYGLRLASVQASGGQAKEALATVAALRKLPPPVGDDPRIDLREEKAARGLSDFRRQLAAASAASAKGARQGARLLVAEALLSESRAYISLGQLNESKTAAGEAGRIYTEIGDRNGQAAALHEVALALTDEDDPAGAQKMDEQVLTTCRAIGNKRCMGDALNNLGALLKRQGDLRQAQLSFEQCLALRRETGDRVGEAATLNNLASLFYDEGKLPAAEAMYEQGLAIAREIGQKRGIARALTNLSIVMQDRGDLPGARKWQEESVAIRRQIGDRIGVAIALNNLAVLLLYQGDLDGATKRVDEQIALEREVGNQRGLAYGLFVRGEILMRRDRLRDARKAHEEALAMRTRLKEKLTVAESRLSLAALSIEEGRPSDAEPIAVAIQNQFREQAESDTEILAGVLLARSLLAQGKLPAAEKQIRSLEAKSFIAEKPRLRFEAGITSARIHAAQGNADAVKNLQSIIEAATTLGFVCYRLEASLALGEAEIRLGAAVAGQADLTRVEKDASATGFLLIARTARTTRGDQ